MAWLSRVRGVSPVTRLAAIRRSFGSAAALEFDYDSDDEYLYGDDRRLAEPRLGLDGSGPDRGVQWVLMGAPGAWRHVFAEKLSKLLEVPHISMGSLVRQELNPRSSLYKEIASAVNERKLVPKSVVFALLSKRLEEGYARGETGFILHGIPRTRFQAETLDQIAQIDLVVNLKCSEDHLVNRNETALPQQEFLGSMLHSPAAINARRESVGVYAQEVEEYYRKQRKLLDFHVGGATSADTWQGLLAALHLKQVNLTTSQKLTL
ncbi:P-loop containing nucleoside triphosphate hydrolase [Arabidopsis suecica]|uniref:P-loop containing nucleoside triphosphate hydrolase n=1 Tax=Arabidopsis suecica TaxID=45249 RepID=A0A8T2FDR1_ARASU|nr:P-loop containing nucleoside triphosphate hydrolase [Arabidopsis suecica]